MADTTVFSSSSKGFSIASSAASFGKGIVGVFQSINRAMMVNSTAHQRLAQVERLSAKTDAELADLGIAREDIVRRCFGDLFWN